MVRDITNTSDPADSLTSYQVEPIIFSTIGLILVAVSIPALANMVAYNSAIDSLSPDEAMRINMIASSKGFTARYIARIIVGLFLIFFSQKLCGWITKVRKKIAQ